MKIYTLKIYPRLKRYTLDWDSGALLDNVLKYDKLGKELSQLNYAQQGTITMKFQERN